MKWLVTKNYENMLLREYLRDVQGFSRTIVKGLKFHGGRLLVNGKDVTVRKALKEGDTVEVCFPPENSSAYIVPEFVDFPIIYEDEDVLIIDKPAGIATMPSAQHKTGTISNGILHHYQKNHVPYTVHIVTRLDRDTSGLLLVAKHKLSHSILAQSQINGEIERGYQAVVFGHLKEKDGTIDSPIARHPESIIKRVVHANGKQAITHFQVMREINNMTLVQIKLETGRTHQIRVHFTHIGHPLMGDDLYGGRKEGITRQALHCVSLSFIHPMTKEQYTFTSSLPKDIKKLIQEGTSTS